MRSTLIVGFHLRYRRPRKHAHIKVTRKEWTRERRDLAPARPDIVSPGRREHRAGNVRRAPDCAGVLRHHRAIRSDNVSQRVSGAATESSHCCRIDSIVRSRGEGMRVHIYSRRPRLVAVFLCGGLGGHAALISRRKARRINSEKLISSRRALSSRSCWTSRGSRNVTGTLPFGSFVLGMKRCVLLYHTPCQD